jgi:N-acetylglucosaminyl-diphospho-decaprenol L-rhamnosyltransferase
MDSTLVDVVVVSYRSRSQLRGCVEHLAGSDKLHVVVVDNASDDGSLESVSDLAVTAIPLEDNRGFAAGCNAGWRAGAAPYVLLLNPDARIQEESALRLVSAAESNQRIGAVAPRILEEDGTLDYSLRRFPRVRSTLSQAFFLHRVFPRASWSDETIRDEARYAVEGPVEWASGACLLIRRSLLEQLDGLDEGFFMYCEDKDLCKRIWSAGSEVRYDPAAVVVHEGGASESRSRLLGVMAASRIRYARKHARPLQAVLERGAVALLALTHVVVSRDGMARRAGHLHALLVAAGIRRPDYPRRSPA